MYKTAHFISEPLDFTGFVRCFSKEKDRGIEKQKVEVRNLFEKFEQLQLLYKTLYSRYKCPIF